MRYHYGIKQLREALLRLSTGHSLEDRLSGAYTELDRIFVEDVITRHYKAIELWKADYLTLINSGDVIGSEKQMNKLIQRVVDMAIEVCETNTKLLK